MSTTKRRAFLKTAAAAGAGALVFGCNESSKGSAPAVQTGKTYEWKMITAWPPRFPVFADNLDMLKHLVESKSSGRMKITIYGGGELVPPLETFDAVSQGLAEMGHSASYYWGGKMPAVQFFTGVPFGMDASQSYTWLYQGGGLELWKEIYGQYNIIPYPCGNTGGQMGGWFNREINSVEDFKGLKMRTPGIGGQVLSRLGVATILSPGAELYTNLERGVLDALEWVGPYHDYLMGFHRVAKYYYYPGWQEPSGGTELLVNKQAFEALPKDLQDIISSAVRTVDTNIYFDFYAKNTEYYFKMREENVNFKKFPDEVIERLRVLSREHLEEMTADDPASKKVYDSYRAFQKRIAHWAEYCEKNYVI